MSEASSKRTAVSRRTLIGAATVAPVLASGGGAAVVDDLIAQCANFVAIDVRIGRLVRRWGRLETEAFMIPGWLTLPRQEQLNHPQGREMADIDAMLGGLFEQRASLLEALPGIDAIDPSGIAAKVAVAAKAIAPDDHPEAHALIAGVARELAKMCCPGCHRALVPETWIDWSASLGRTEAGQDAV